jgi:hypothetical protein
MEARDVGAYELARAAGVTPPTVYAIASGRSRGLPVTRRLLRAALSQWPVVVREPAVPELRPQPAPEEPRRGRALEEYIAEARRERLSRP